MTILPIVFLTTFIGGLVLAVFAMLHGVEHMRRSRRGTPSAFLNLPAVAAFAVGFGAVGYPLASRTRLSTWGILLIAVATGIVATSGMITLLARWALRGIPQSGMTDDEIQGQFATVTRDIPINAPGEISYEHLGRKLNIPARGLGKKALPSGTDVVIDRIEGGVAFVEEWSVVEQRL